MVARPMKTGFTLIELLVVIAIFAILMAIILPIGKRLSENNITNTCAVHLATIGQALKLYYLDEQGVPPIGVLDANDDGKPDNTTVDLNAWPGLRALFYMDYLKDEDVLHCPRDLYTSSGAHMTKSSPEYYESYMNLDPKAKPGNSLDCYKYMPYRWATAAAYPNDYRRQLAQAARDVAIGGTTYLVSCGNMDFPSDDTIITWCNHHADYYTLNGHGQYLVLYWDGSVRMMDEELFTDTAFGPPQAWMVKPTDSAH